MHTNRLSREKSPYLLQHQHNPVDWQAWNEEAFAQARRENKPIFLSIGYSTCHWCHVMERESFEDPKVAEILNANFVSIKIDREERPDVDRIYMNFVQATTGSGGWPLNCFLTPELKPFYGGTYFPPKNAHGRPSFTDLLHQIIDLWKHRSQEMLDSAEELHERLALRSNPLPPTDSPRSDILRNAAVQLKQYFDPVNGGFGDAPKFPQPSQPEFLLNFASHFGDPEAVNMVAQTCDKMADGGIYDQLGGGFSRYSVDAQWLVPHFEKMLYDNAQLLDLYLNCYLVTGNTRYAETAHGIIRYLLKDMTHALGGFYSAEDADSEGKEGKFYCWTLTELSKLLTVEEFNVAKKYYGLTESGNFLDHSDPQPLRGQNVLSVVNPQLSEVDTSLLKSANEKMLRERSTRVRPHLDDKILSSWNGLMLASLSRAGVVLERPEYLSAAEKNFEFIKTNLWDEDAKTLYHRWRDGERDSVQLLQAYAFLLAGVVELYQSTLKPGYLEFAIKLADSLLERFEDSEHGGFWQSGKNTPNLIANVKDDYDGAEPAGNSVAALALLKLAAISGIERYRLSAEKTIHLNSQRMARLPQATPYLLQALSFIAQEPVRVVISTAKNEQSSESLLRAVHQVYQPNKVVLSNEGAVEAFAKSIPSSEHSQVYICFGNSCQAPTTDPIQIKDSIKKSSQLAS